jgi:hypothetical protein
MAESLGYLLAQSYRITSTQTITTTDDRGGPTNRTVAAAWYRTRLANGAGTAHNDPAEFLAAVTAALGSLYWLLTIAPATGKVQFTYLGATSGSINLSGSPTLRALLGMTGNVPSTATGTTYTAPHQPTHCVFAAFVDPDSGWVDQPQRYAASSMPDGTVYGWHDGRATLRRQGAFKLLPKDSGFVTSLSSTSTQAYPVSSRWLSPSTGEPAQAPPWSAVDTVVTAHTLECGITWGDLQGVLSGSVTAYDKVYLTPEMASAARVTLSIPGYDARRDVSFELSYAGAGSL